MRQHHRAGHAHRTHVGDGGRAGEGGWVGTDAVLVAAVTSCEVVVVVVGKGEGEDFGEVVGERGKGEDVGKAGKEAEG